MSSKNKFGFAPLEADKPQARKARSPGPMGVAVRDVAENLSEATEAKVEQRRRNADDAKTYRAAVEEGRLLVPIALSEIATDDLPRDRMDLEGVAQSDEMEELKASIRERGQKEPAEVYIGPDGRYQLKKGWRRFTALSQLFAETGDSSFNSLIARVEVGQGDRVARYVDMVEENVIREDLTFAEMAQVAITAAQDGGVDEMDPTEMVPRLYSALHKTKRSYVKNFVTLLSALGDSLPWPKSIPRNLGVEAARAIKDDGRVDDLRAVLEACTTVEEQNAALVAFVKADGHATPERAPSPAPKQKFEFFVGKTKVTAREGECRLVSNRDFATVPKGRLEAAVKAFEKVLTGGGRIP